MKTSRILLVVNTLLLVVIWGFAGIKYAGLPNVIPIHFNAQGVVDREAGKAAIWLLPGIATFIHLMLIGVSSNPESRLLNVPQRLRNNKESLQRYLFSLQLPIMLLFLDIIVESVRIAEGQQTELSGIFSFFLGVILAIVGINIIRSIRDRNMKSNK